MTAYELQTEELDRAAEELGRIARVEALCGLLPPIAVLSMSLFSLPMDQVACNRVADGAVRAVRSGQIPDCAPNTLTAIARYEAVKAEWKRLLLLQHRAANDSPTQHAA